MIRILLLTLLIATSALACGDAASSPAIDAGPIGDGDGDGDGDDAGPIGDGDFEGAACGGPQPEAQAIAVEIAEVGATPPEGAGGVLKSGTYDLVAVTYFSPSDTCVIPDTIRDTLKISVEDGTATETFVYTYADGFIERFAFAYEISTSGSSSTWDVVCPEPPSSSDQAYTASGDSLELTVGQGNCASVWTFERR